MLYSFFEQLSAHSLSHSDGGVSLENSRFYRRTEDKLATAQRSHSKPRGFLWVTAIDSAGHQGGESGVSLRVAFPLGAWVVYPGNPARRRGLFLDSPAF